MCAIMLPGFNRMARITRKAIPGLSTVSGFPHYFPLSYLGDYFWDNVNVSYAPIIRVTDQHMQEVPFQIVDFDQDNKRGALWFKAPINAAGKSFFIHWDTTTAGPYGEIDDFGSRNVWTDFVDVIHANEQPGFFEVQYVNSATGAIGAVLGTIQGIPSEIEQAANYFPDPFSQNTVYFTDLSDNAFDAWDTPRTFIFLLQVVAFEQTEAILLRNWTLETPGFQPFQLKFTFDPVTPNNTRLTLELGQNGVPYYNRTAPGALAGISSGGWYVVTIKCDAGAGGFAVDFDKVATAITPGEDVGVFPTDQNSPTTQIGEVGYFHNIGLASLMIYNGALNKSQRDVFFDNWKDTVNFWTVNDLSGPPVCINSPISDGACINSPISEAHCLNSKIK